MTVLDERPTYYEGVTKAVSNRLEDHYTDHIGDEELGRKAAQVILDNAHDPHYRMALIFALDEFVSNMIDQHRVELQAMLDAADHKAKSQVRKAIMKSYLDSRVNEEISKINGWDEDEHPRGGGGRFKDKLHRAVQGNTGETLDSPFGPGDREQAQRYLAAYTQMVGMPEGRRQRAVFTILDTNGNLRDSQPSHTLPPMSQGERIIHVRPIGYEFPHQVGGQVFNIAQSLGMDSDRAGSAGATAHHFNEAVKQSSDWGKLLSNATKALYYATGNGANPTKELSAQVAHMVGTHGPEATKVLAPNMRRAAYRYRGLEAGPEYLDENILGLPKVTTKPNGTVDVQSIEGVENQLANNLHGELPSDETIATLLKAGSMPPSRGYIIDKTGKPITLATGAMDDHYVPFNLRNLGKLNKGSYVRTRAYGGPTTEDFQVALASGARSFVIESKQGTYRVDLAERAGTKPAKIATRLPGKAGELYSHLPGNRFGDANTKLVVKRYSRLLDAIQNKKITATDPDTGETNTLKLDAQGYKVALQALQAQFPYLIKNVEFKPVSAQGQTAEGHRAGQGAEDIGYVRPYYLKPSKAAGTYWDPKIEPDAARRGMSFDDMETYRYGVARRNRRERARPAAAPAATEGTGTYRVQRDREAPDNRPAWQKMQPGPIQANVPASAAPVVHAGANPEGMGDRVEIRPQGERDLRDEINDDEMDDWEQWLTAVKPRLHGLPEVEGPGADEDLKDFMESFHPAAAPGTDRYKEHNSWREQYQNNASQRDELERLIDGAMGANGITGVDPPPRFEVLTPEEQRDREREERQQDEALPPADASGSGGRKWTSETWKGSNAQAMLAHARMFGVYQGHKKRIAEGMANPGQINWVKQYETPPKPGSKAYKMFGGRAPADWWVNADGAQTPIGPAVIENPDGSQTPVSPVEFYIHHPEPSLGDHSLFDHYSDVEAALKGDEVRFPETYDHVSADDPDARAEQAMRELDRRNDQDYS